METKSVFATLSAVDCSKHTEKKGNLTYLSWAWAWSILLQNYPSSSFEMHSDTLHDDGCVTVSCTVTVEGIARTMWLPVMDNRNNAIKNPDARKISDSKMRCLVKAIALHGLGLYIYAGEDIPEQSQQKAGGSAMDTSVDAFNALGEEEQQFLRDIALEIIGYHKNSNIDSAYDEYKKLDNEEALAMWHLLPSQIRSALKKYDGQKKMLANSEIAGG